MEKIKRLINIHIPLTTCTLKCDYCYITHHRLFGGPLPEIKFTPQEVRKALSKERLGGTCLIAFCAGGETLLPPTIVSYFKALLEEGHYLFIVTNGTLTKRFDEIAALPPELLKKVFFKFSYHYREFKEKGLMDKFFANVNKMYRAGASFTLELTPSDADIELIDEIKDTAVKNVGAFCHVTVARDERVRGELPILTDMCRDEYQKTWSVFNSSFFDYKMSVFGVKRKEFCYAGAWTAYINLITGEMTQCYKSHYKQSIFKNLDKPIRFLPIGNNCMEEHCYNAHSMIVLGTIPKLEAPTLAEMRNRVCTDGSEWLYPEIKSFFESKLYETNQEYTGLQKLKVNLEINLRRLIYLPIRVAVKIKRTIFK